MELMVVNTELAEQERKEIDLEIDQTIAKYKNNRYEVNRLVFESVAALTASENYSHELNSQSKLKRLWGGFSGKNRELQNKIDSSLARSQYASQRTLQKLAEQNLMSFELITAVNNKLNASIAEIDAEINKIYGTLVTFFKQTKSEIIQLENRVERLERNVALLNWNSSIEYQMWNGVEYADLDVVSKIVCMARDFYDITKGNWTTSDLLLLKSSLAVVGLNPREMMNYGEFIKTLYYNDSLCMKLFQGESFNENIEPSYVGITSAINKGNKLQKEDAYVVQGVVGLLKDNNINVFPEKVVDKLVSEYSLVELLFSMQANVPIFDLVLEILFNLEQLKYIPPKSVEERLKEAEQEYLKGNHEIAISMFEDLAKDNCGRAMFFLGEYYRFGYGNVVDIDAEKGFMWHEHGASHGEKLSMLNLAYAEGIDLEEKEVIKKSMLQDIKEMAEKGDIIAQYELATMCQDASEKIYWLSLSAKQGNWLSMNRLGNAYYEGTGVETDYKMAVKWYQASAERGYNWATYNLATMYQDGLGVEQDYYEAVHLYKKLAEQGLAEAQNQMGIRYQNGEGVGKDYKKAVYWYKKAADQGFSWGQYNLAKLYKDGNGCERDEKMAFAWCKNAAEQGLPAAENLLAYYYDNGTGTDVDQYTAFKWYKKSAEHGNSTGQSNLAICYKRGEGTDCDIEKAKYWAKKAAENGNSTAKENLMSWFGISI